MINIFLFLGLGIAGFIITIFIYYTGKNPSFQQQKNPEKTISLFGITFSIISLIYLLRILLMLLIGLYITRFDIVLVGGLLAVLPITIYFFLIKYTDTRQTH